MSFNQSNMSVSVSPMNSVFNQLIAQFPTFDSLKTYLDSIGVKAHTKEGDPLVIFRYHRESCDMKNPVVQLFRSVIWDSLKNKPVFVAPVKSQSLETLPTDFSSVVVEEFVDGVMVNLFVDPYKGCWRIATRSRLDADNKFYKYTFSELFFTTWNDSFPNQQFGEGLNSQWGYSFVLQHPLNRIVVPVMKRCLVLVEVMNISASTEACPLDNMQYVRGELMKMLVSSTQNYVSGNETNASMNLLTPRSFAVTSTQECLLLLNNMEQFEGIRSQGIVVRHLLTGQRWKMRTNAYVYCRKLRGNHSQLEYVWFDNLKNNTLEQYLTMYPEEVAAAHIAMSNWSKVVSEIYDWYVHVFKVRDVAKETIPAHLKGILFDLHGQYISRLSKEKKSLDWKEHQLIMANQDLKRIVFLSTFKEGATPPPSFQKRQKFASAKVLKLETKMDAE